MSFLDELVGMYALALWDGNKRRLVLARDRLGVKPLYYHLSDELFVFGSEAKAVMAHPRCPREVDWERALGGAGLAEMVLSDAGPFSFFEGIDYLPAAHYLILDDKTGSVNTKRYWNLPLDVEPRAGERSERELIEGFREIFERAVRLNLMSDVEYGIFLSGGIDSVAIAFVAAREGGFHSFSVLSQSTFSHGDAGAAHLASKLLGLENHQVLFRWQDRVENRVPFLDHRLVEYCMNIPTSLHERLFWNKRILREAMAGTVPDELRWREKVPFYDGNDKRYAQRMLHGLMTQEGGALIEEAFPKTSKASEVLDRESVERLVKRSADDPELAAVQPLLVVINIALLDRMAKGIGTSELGRDHIDADVDPHSRLGR